ncbi:MAG: hypothetical protein KF858_03810 [Candidatus Sumerlaeia bacterium]|nr:hypothetical protein [Candidatus Sumerlaeia bacterium]
MATTRTRRAWRRLYRRSRVYIPIILVLLLGMALFLPLSPTWLTRRVERELTRATGLPVRVERVRLHLFGGEALARGVELGAGGERFRIEAVRLEGRPSALLAGDGQWPERIVLSGFSEVRIVHSDRGFEPRGALANVLTHAAIPTPPSPPPSPVPPEAPPPGGLLERATPTLTLQHLVVRLESETHAFDPVKVTLDAVHVPSRDAGRQAIAAEFRGLVTLGRPERLHGNVQVLPGDREVRLHAVMGGLAGRLPIPGFGVLETDGRGVRLDVAGVEDATGAYRLNVELSADRFEAREQRPGGERWFDDDLRLALEGTIASDGTSLRNVTVRLTGEQADARLEGDVSLVGGFETDARLRVARLPNAFYRLARREAARGGMLFEPLTSDTLRLDLAVRGPIVRPDELDFHGVVGLSHLQVREPDWPEPLTIRRIEGTVTRDRVHLPVVEAQFGDLMLRAEAEGPLPLRAGEAGTLSARMTIDGTASYLVALVRGLGYLPPEVRDATMPVAFEAQVEVPLANRDGSIELSLDPADVRFAGTLAWRAGDVALRDLPGTIHLAPGRITLTDTHVAFSNLSAAWREVSLNVDGALDSATPGWLDPPAFRVSTVAMGPVRSLLELAGHLTYLPVPPDIATGSLRVRAEANGTWGEWDALDYSVAASLIDGSTTLAIPHPLALDRLYAELIGTPAGIELRRLQARIEHAATVVGTGRINDSEAAFDFEIDTPLWVPERVAPHDLEEIVLEGHARATGTVRLAATQALPEGPDVPRRWIAALTAPGGPSIGLSDEAPLRFELDARIFPGEGAGVYQRDFPHPVTNVRGDIRADASGFTFRNVRSTWGDAENVLINGRVTLGHVGPLTVDCDVVAPNLSINDWMNGWGEREYAERPFVAARRPRNPDAPARLMARVIARMHLGRTEFLSVRASDVRADLVFESWRNRNDTIEVALHDAVVYGGRMNGEALVALGQHGTGELARFQTRLNGTNVDVHEFLADLMEQPADFTGKFSGSAHFGGSIGDYSDWAGEGDYHVVDSRFIGDQAFRRMSNVLRLGRDKWESPTTLRGTALMADEQIHFPDMVIQNRDIRMVTAGTVHFNAAIDFLVAIEILTGRLSDIPVVSSFVDYFNALKDQLVSLHVTGKIREPIISTSSGLRDLTPVQRGRDFLQRTGQTLRRAPLPFPEWTGFRRTPDGQPPNGGTAP